MVGSAQRVLERFCRTLRAEISRHDAALRAPLEETQARLDRLRSLTTNIDTSLRELRFLLDAAEADLGRALESRRSAFTAHVRPDLHAALRQWLDQQVDRPSRLRRRAMEHADGLAQRAVEQWFAELEPIVHALYVEASDRFVTIVNRFLAHLSGDADETTAADLPAERGLRERRQFYFTHLMHVASTRPAQWLADHVGMATHRRRDILSAATRYMDRLVGSNASRVEHDFANRALESRRALEAIVRRRLQTAEAAAQRALDVGIAKRQLDEPAIKARIAGIQALASELEASCASLTA